MVLKEVFYELVFQYTDREEIVNRLWKEISDNYSESKRYYHNLEHLDKLLEELTNIKDKLEDWNTILFSLFYHDIIYNATRKDNEKRSAELAIERMMEIGVEEVIIESTKLHILATKSHSIAINSDTNYFTDADVSILGYDWEVYSKYFLAVRKEYKVYPNVVYKAGRKKVLNHFLAMERIFKTDYFYDRYEKRAKENMNKELALIDS